MLIRFRGKAVAICTNTIFHCNGFGFYTLRSQYLYSSTSTPTHFLVKYLVDSLGFSKQEAASTASKVTSSKTFKNPYLVLHFLKQTGLDNTQMKEIVSTVPKLLLSNVSKTLKPKFLCLMNLGLSGSDLVDVIAKDTTIFDRGLETHLRPTIDLLRRTLGSDENIVKAIKRAPWLLSFRAHDIMESNVLLLRNSGVPDVRIRKLLLKNPRYITQKTDWVKDLLHRVENDFRVPRDSPMFPSGFRTLASQKKSTLERKIGIFKSFGWSDNDILEMFRKLPSCVSLSEVRIQKALNLFMKELGFEPAYLVSHPAILGYSLEKRVLPRMQVLKILDEKKLQRRKLALYGVVSMAESKFVEYFVLPYKDQIPDLYEPLKKIVAPCAKIFLNFQLCNAPNTITTNVLLLQDTGLSDEKIRRFILRSPACIMRNPGWFEDVIHRVERDLGIPRESGKFLYGIAAIISFRQSTLTKKIDVYKSFGWSDENIRTMIRKQPSCLSCSEATICKHLTFLMNEVGCTSEYLASRPNLLKYSLEKRIIPRYKVLKILIDKLLKKGVGIYCAAKMTPSKFMEECLLPYKDKIPIAYELYMKSVG
ncbi:uncharacterized protein LOC132034889 [Lycium ferocissimum]|uniref:uncharacterized protein LOC132034889 n=1 Tax=Lycium ferocissimum TaxID=112874 RepID=UPI002814C517|nr:uncharacterized protein LOC132034889 [Lycium ferocissimum]